MSDAIPVPPKAFISYSWSSVAHSALVREWAQRLMESDGIDILLDQFDLKEGQDKYAYMERMVNDQSVSHVLIVSDKIYAQKADSRKAGVGTESQIISKEMYDKVAQSKFIPIVCEFDPNGEPSLPTFCKNRIYLDFSSPEKANENWERLVRLIYNKPLFPKPSIGKPPSYITEDLSVPMTPAAGKWNTFRQAFLSGRHGLSIYREDFLDSCIGFADSLRIRQSPQTDSWPQTVVTDCRNLVSTRNLICDWVLLEARTTPDEEFGDLLVSVLERLLELRARPVEVNSWSDAWFDAHSLFVFESFLYVVATLIKRGAYGVLNRIFTANYLRPETDRRSREGQFSKFDVFYASPASLQEALAPAGRQLHSPVGELIKRQAERRDILLESVIEADLVVYLAYLIFSDVNNAHWHPQTWIYSKQIGPTPIFLRAAERRNFGKLGAIMGVKTGDELREKIYASKQAILKHKWLNEHFFSSFFEKINAGKWDTV